MKSHDPQWPPHRGPIARSHQPMGQGSRKLDPLTLAQLSFCNTAATAYGDDEDNDNEDKDSEYVEN